MVGAERAGAGWELRRRAEWVLAAVSAKARSRGYPAGPQCRAEHEGRPGQRHHAGDLRLRRCQSLSPATGRRHSFDVLREAERRRQLQLPHRKRDEAGATAQGPKAGGASGRKRSRKERKGPVAPRAPAGPCHRRRSSHCRARDALLEEGATRMERQPGARQPGARRDTGENRAAILPGISTLRDRTAGGLHS